MAKSRWKIHKFGGSSLGDAACFRRVAGLLEAMPDPSIGVVVSAMGGMTDDLIELATLAEQANDHYVARLHAIGERYATTAGELLDGEPRAAVLDAWGSDADDVADVLNAIALVRSAPQRSRDVIAGYGEIWSARLLAALLAQHSAERGGTWIDAREVISVHQTELGPSILWDRSRENFEHAVPQDFSGIAVITGFIATDENGLQTTLGR
ncbi:MAG: bifunctional aspartate kinase/homoserine dehydrogenase I, partial [Gammaproteobacteria bacterium]|nr:bifunctional aspartate kinase/homoserine dehydrogenase I [Gammaproteobacteria bacterium]